MLLSGLLMMTMQKNKEVYKEGDYFFEPADTHMIKVEGDQSRDTDFIIFEVGAERELDSLYHSDGR